MKKIIRLFLVLVVLLNMVIIFPGSAFAEDKQKGNDKSTGWDYSAQLDSANSWGNSNSNVVTTTQNIVGTIIRVMRVVGVGIAIIMLTYVAVKYMSAAPSEKAEFKKSATAYIVGAIVLFGTTGILKLIEDFASQNIN